MSLYSEFKKDLQDVFSDYGYGWTKAKERSCEWLIRKLPDGVGVDVGGTEYLVEKLQQNQNIDISYFDYYPPKSSAINKYITADMEEFGDHFQPASLDFITTRHTLEHSLNPLFQLWQYNRALKDRGTLIVIVPQHVSKWVWFYSHFSCLPLDNWLMLFHRAGFDVVEAASASWKPKDPDFIEYRFILKVKFRGLLLDNDGTTHQRDDSGEDFMSKECIDRLFDNDLEYFLNKSKDYLEKFVFPYKPELFFQLAELRQFGVPVQYKSIVSSTRVKENLAFFECELGKEYSGNARFIYERMLEREPEFQYVWCYSGKEGIPGSPKIVERGSDQYYQYLGQSAVIINNKTFPVWFIRPETFYLQVLDEVPFKKSHWDKSHVALNKRSKPHFYVKSRGWNALLSASKFTTDIYRSAFKYTGEILECGHPRHDIFFSDKRYLAVRNNIRNKLPLENSGSPVYLYICSGKQASEANKKALNVEVEKIFSNIESDAVLVTNNAIYSSTDFENSRYVVEPFVRYELIDWMCAADVLISDQPSVILDWILQKKPVTYYMPSADDQNSIKNDFYFDLQGMSLCNSCTSPNGLYEQLCKALHSKSESQLVTNVLKGGNTSSADVVIDFLLSRINN